MLTINVPDEVLDIEPPLLGTWELLRESLHSYGNNPVVRRLSDGEVFLVQEYGNRGVRLFQSNPTTGWNGQPTRRWGDPTPVLAWSDSAVGYCRTGLPRDDMPADVARALPLPVLPGDAPVEDLRALRDAYQQALADAVPKRRVDGLAEARMHDVSVAFNEVAKENAMCPVYEQRQEEFNNVVPGPLHLLSRAETHQQTEVEYTVTLDVPYTVSGSYSMTVTVTGPPHLNEGQLSELIDANVSEDDIYREQFVIEDIRYNTSPEYDDGYTIEHYDAEEIG